MQILCYRRPPALRKIQQPVFVVGCCNSGTTILWQALKENPAFTGPPTEGQDLKDLPHCMRHFLGRRTSRMFAHSRFRDAYRLTEQDFDLNTAERIAEVYADHCETGKRFLEKSPANSVRTRFLQSIFPDASFVIIVRNGYAVSEGIRRKRWFDPDRPHLAGLPTTIDEAAQQWREANRILLNDRGCLRRSIIVKYEEMVHHTHKVLTNVLEFCRCETRAFSAPNFERGLNAAQVGRLSAQEKNTIRRCAGQMLSLLGYDTVDQLAQNRSLFPQEAVASL